MAANTTQVSTNGKFIAISAVNATLTTALDDCINEMDAQNCPMNQTQIAFAYDSTNCTVIAIVKRH